MVVKWWLLPEVLCIDIWLAVPRAGGAAGEWDGQDLRNQSPSQHRLHQGCEVIFWWFKTIPVHCAGLPDIPQPGCSRNHSIHSFDRPQRQHLCQGEAQSNSKYAPKTCILLYMTQAYSYWPSGALNNQMRGCHWLFHTTHSLVIASVPVIETSLTGWKILPCISLLSNKNKKDFNEIESIHFIEDKV